MLYFILRFEVPILEIERKFLIDKEAFDYRAYPFKELEQGYLCTNPVVRVRKEDSNYYLTYKGKGLLAREEYNLPLNEEAYRHLIVKSDGLVIAKRRYLIPYGKFTVELDEFKNELAPLLLAEVEFESVEEANSFVPPKWFTKDVTNDPEYHNSNMSKRKG